MTLRNAFADLATQATSASIDAKTPALVSGSVPVTLPAAQVVTLTPPAAITGFALESTLGSVLAKLNGSVAVTGSFYQATQPVSFAWSGLTDAQLRASAVPMSAASLPLPAGAATEAGVAAVAAALGSPLQAGGTVTVSNLPATQAVSAASLPLPDGASSESSQEELLGNITLLLAAILEKLPRTDANDRAIVNTADQGNVTVAVASAQTLATVTTVGTVTTVTTVGNQTNIGGRDASHAAFALANIGTAHIYNQIIVS